MQLVDVFPVRSSSIPRLHGFNLSISSRTPYLIGGKLGYRLTKDTDGIWLWSDRKLITDVESPIDEILDKAEKVIEELWNTQPDTYGQIRGLRPDTSWKPSKKAIANYARALCNKQSTTIEKLLREEDSDLGPAKVERYHELGTWVIQNQPALSISVKSRITYKRDVSTFARELETHDDLVGIWAADKNSGYKGEISRIVGVLGDERPRLMSISQNPATRKLLESSPDDDPVLTIESGRHRYDYAASCLNLIVRLDYLDRFGISGSAAIKKLRIDPMSRQQLVWKIGSLLRFEGIVSYRFDSENDPSMFSNWHQMGYTDQVRFHDGYIDEYNSRTIMKHLQNHGIYQISDALTSTKSIKACIVNTTGNECFDAFIQNIQSRLGSLGFSLEITGQENLDKHNRAAFEKCVLKLLDAKPDVVLCILPDAHVDYDGFLYQSLKMLTVGRGIASQGVRRTTLNNRYAVNNIVLGILGKTGPERRKETSMVV
ncbi:MAG: hypothetical protein ACW98Y_15825 [Candidatus Thorarchaeota archaeon]